MIIAHRGHAHGDVAAKAVARPQVTLPALGVFAALHTIRKGPLLINYPLCLTKIGIAQDLQHSAFDSSKAANPD